MQWQLCGLNFYAKLKNMMHTFHSK